MTRPRRAPRALLMMLMGLAPPAWAVEGCPVPEKPEYPEGIDEAPIEFTADDAELDAEGVSTFHGSVIVRQGVRELEASRVRFDSRTGRMDNGMNGMSAMVFHLLGEEEMAKRWARSVCYMWMGRERGHHTSQACPNPPSSPQSQTVP